MIDERITKAFYADNGFRLKEHCVVLARIGSDSHGTKIPDSDTNAIDDTDFMGFVVPPLQYLLGLKEFDNWTLQFEELDVVVYSLAKAFRLLLKCNPNIVGMLWLRDEDYVHRTPEFDTLLARRDIFTSKAAAQSFIGYSYGQLKKMEAFDLEKIARYTELTSWLELWGIDTYKVLQQHPDQMTALLQNEKYPCPYPDSWNNWDREQVAEYLREFNRLHKKSFSAYQGAKRKAMVRKYGMDVKNASHMIRLLRMGSEFLSTGQLNVFRTQDAEELKDIKQGQWTLGQVKAEAEMLFDQIRYAESASTLKDAPDRDKADELLVQMTMATLDLVRRS